MMMLSNTGETRAEISGTVNVLRQAGSGWRRVTSLDFDSKQILPGISYPYILPLEKRIPAGTYRLNAVFNADGRRFKPINKIVEYQGDPTITDVSDEVELMIEPAVLEVEGVAKARRSGRLRIQNPSDAVLTLRFGVSLPKTLRGIAMGDILGEHYSCAEFCTINPPEVRLAAGGERTISIQTVFPDDDQFPYRYSSVTVQAFNETNEPTFDTSVLMITHNRQVEPSPSLVVRNTSISQLDNANYAVSATLTNLGNVHLQPQCEVQLQDRQGLNVLQRVPMTSDMNIVLPMGQPSFNAELNLANMESGDYRLKVVCTYAGLTVEDIIPVNLVARNNTIALTVIN